MLAEEKQLPKDLALLLGTVMALMRGTMFVQCCTPLRLQIPDGGSAMATECLAKRCLRTK
jgi:hypothetical protein